MKVKDFAKALKTEPSVLLERMQSAGLSHKSESDEITPSDKQALLLFLKDRKSGPKKVVTTSDGDIKAKPNPLQQKKLHLVKALLTILRLSEKLQQNNSKSSKRKEKTRSKKLLGSSKNKPKLPKNLFQERHKNPLNLSM